MAWWVCAGAAETPREAKADVDILLIVVGASGRGAKPTFAAGIPAEFRKKLEGGHLAYSDYKLVALERKPAAYDEEVTFSLPNKETLGVTPSANPKVSHPLRIVTRVLDDKKKVIQKIQVLVPYGKPFLIHRPTDASAVIMGVSGHKPGKP